MKDWIWTTVITLLPIAELRGGLPYALAKGIPWLAAYPYCIFVNALVVPIAYIFLDTLHHIFYKWKFYAGIFDKFVEGARRKLGPKVDRWGIWGLAIFVGIPLPITGVWTGTLGAWILGLSRRQTMIAVLIGVSISGLIVSAITLLSIEALDFFIKHV